jgi:multidrug transporter EmrE-like cation transporter
MLLVLLATVIGSGGAVFLKLGAVRLTDVWSLLNWRLGLGVALYLVSSVFYGLGIKHGQISVLFPMASLANVWTLVWGRMFFQEPFNRQKFIGLGVILLGVLFLALGSNP